MPIQPGDYDNDAINGKQLSELMQTEIYDRLKGDVPETVAEAFCELAARIASLEQQVANSNIGDRTADSLDAQSLKVGGVDVSPNTHGHGNITSAGKVGTTANKPLITGTGGVVQAGSFGSSANTFCEGNDSRLAPAADMYVAQYGVISEFTAMTNARGEGKKVCVAVGLGGGSSGFNSAEAIVPLSYVEFGSESAVVAFYFNMPRDSYGDVNARGSILQVKCTSAGWDVNNLSPYYADTAGVAATAGSANTATSATTAGSATNATNATNDGAGAEIKTTYVMDARTGSTVVGDANQFIASVDVMTDDASVGNRKYLQFTKKFLPVACKMTLLATPIQDETTGDHVVLEYGAVTNYYSVACRYSTSYNSITGPNATLASMKRFIEVDFDYYLLRSHSNEHIGVQFALCAVSRETGNNSRITKISMADDTVFAKATVQFYAPSGVVWYRGHVHLVGDKSTISSFGNKGLALVATSLIGEQYLTGYKTVNSIIDNITIKETSEY